MITGISIDSREIIAGDLFVALPGTVSDGHKFLAAAQSAGASAALVSKIDRGLDMPQIYVTDCLQALRVVQLPDDQNHLDNQVLPQGQPLCTRQLCRRCA